MSAVVNAPPALVVDLWTDGSGTASGPIGWAWTLDCHGWRRQVSGCEPEGTNNRAELLAVITGIEAITRPSFVVVHSDSEYVQKPFVDGYIKRWQANGWRTRTGGVKNVDLWERLVAAVEPHIVSWEWCRGHDGIALNEWCDKAAGEARKTQAPTDSGRFRWGADDG